MLSGYACPCCGYLTLNEPAGGTFEICPVCYWEDDQVQLDNPDYIGGANEISLKTARFNFVKYGVSDLRFSNLVRNPLPSEFPKEH